MKLVDRHTSLPHYVLIYAPCIKNTKNNGNETAKIKIVHPSESFAIPYLVDI